MNVTLSDLREANIFYENSVKRRKVVLVTGASVGLGLELAKQLIEGDEFFLVLTGRETSSLRFKNEGIFSSKNILLREMDIQDKTQINQLMEEIHQQLGGVDVLINNAGISERSTVEDSSKRNRQHQLDVNYLAPFELIAQVLPRMRENRSGQIINISSVGGFMAMPTMSAYSASKFALEAASESLWYEMKPWGIHVTLVIPGFINSLGHLNTTGTAGSRISEGDSNEAYFEHYKNMNSLVGRFMRGTIATNESIAKQIAKLLKDKNPPLRVNVTFDAKLFYWLRKILPPGVYHYILYKLLPNISTWGATDYKKRIK